MGLLKPEDVQAKWIGLDGPMTYPVKQGRPAAPLTFDGCAWVWATEPGVNARENAPAGTRFFRHVLTIPEGKTISRARFLITADDEFELYVNQQRVLNGSNWKASQIVDIAGQLHTGKNCLAIAATNTSAGPAGLVGKLLVEFGEGEPIVVKIDTSWKTALKESPHWTSAKLDDSEWQPAVHVAKMGEAPWGATPVADEKTKYYACPLFRKEFEVKGEIRRATLYGSALGIYRFHINGRPVGNDYFTPDWTDYHKRVYYNTYDVTDLVKANGPNAIGGVLGARTGTRDKSAGPARTSTAIDRGCSHSLRSNWPTARSRPSRPTARGKPPSGRTSRANSSPAKPTTRGRRFPAGHRPGLDADDGSRWPSPSRFPPNSKRSPASPCRRRAFCPR